MYFQKSKEPVKARSVLLKRFISQTVYTVCTRRNYKIVPVTNLNKYLHDSKVKMNNMYINIGANNGGEKFEQKTPQLPES